MKGKQTKQSVTTIRFTFSLARVGKLYAYRFHFHLFHRYSWLADGWCKIGNRYYYYYYRIALPFVFFVTYVSQSENLESLTDAINKFFGGRGTKIASQLPIIFDWKLLRRCERATKKQRPICLTFNHLCFCIVLALFLTPKITSTLTTIWSSNAPVCCCYWCAFPISSNSNGPLESYFLFAFFVWTQMRSGCLAVGVGALIKGGGIGKIGSCCTTTGSCWKPVPPLPISVTVIFYKVLGNFFCS